MSAFNNLLKSNLSGRDDHMMRMSTMSIMRELSKGIKYNPYDISDDPGPVSEMRINYDALVDYAYGY